MTHTPKDTMHHIVRIGTGLMFLFTGISKQFIFGGFTAAPDWLGPLQGTVNLLFPWFEMLLGLFLLFGIFTVITAAVAFVLLVIITIQTGPFAAGIILQMHTYALFTTLALALGGSSTCCSVDGVLQKKKAKK